MKIDYYRLPFALIIGSALAAIISVLSWAVYTIWLEAPRIAFLITILGPACIIGAYHYLGKLERDIS